MVMLRGYRHIVDFFSHVAWWTTEPRDDLVEGGDAHCLALPGRLYALYLPAGKAITLQLEPLARGQYHGRWWNPRAGGWRDLGDIAGGTWTSPAPPDEDDWALLIERKPG